MLQMKQYKLTDPHSFPNFSFADKFSIKILMYDKFYIDNSKNVAKFRKLSETCDC